MLNPDASSSTDFVYTKLPDNARNAAFDCLRKRDFFPLEHFEYLFIRHE